MARRPCGEADVLQAALEQFYTDHPAPPEIHLPVALSDSETEIVEAWLTDRSDHHVRLVVPKRGEKRGLLDLAARNAQVAYQTRFNETVAAHYDALETLRVVLNLPSIPRRIECFDISTIQGSETVASMVVCEDGRMKRGEYRKFRIRGERDRTRTSEPMGRTRIGPEPRPDPPVPRPSRSSTTSPPCTKSCCAGIAKVLENGGPFPDLILIDGGKGQLSAAYAALESLGLANLVAIGIAKKEELLFTRDHVEPIALAHEQPGAAADPADPRRGAPLCHHLPPPVARETRSAVGARPDPRDRPAAAQGAAHTFGSLAGVRRATREELIAVVGTRCADAVLAHFASS